MKRRKITPVWVDLIILDVAIFLLGSWSRLLHGWPRGLIMIGLFIFQGLHAAIKSRKTWSSRKNPGERHPK